MAHSTGQNKMQSGLKRVCVSFSVLPISSLLSLEQRVGSVAASPCLRWSSASVLHIMCTHLSPYFCGKHEYDSQINSNMSSQKHKYNSHKVKSTVLQEGCRWVTDCKSCTYQLYRESKAIHLSPPKTPSLLIGGKGCSGVAGSGREFG